MTGCTDCGKEQGTINEKFQLAILHAQKLAKEGNEAYAVFVEGQGFIVERYTGQPGCCYTAYPVQ